MRADELPAAACVDRWKVSGFAGDGSAICPSTIVVNSRYNSINAFNCSIQCVNIVDILQCNKARGTVGNILGQLVGVSVKASDLVA